MYVPTVDRHNCLNRFTMFVLVAGLVTFLTVAISPAWAQNADLSIVMKESGDPRFLNEDHIYKITVTNNGPNEATNVVVTDSLPSIVEFVTVAPKVGSSESGGVVTVDLGNMASGTSRDIIITVIGVQEGTVTNVANVASDNDNNLSNNRATESTQFIARVSDVAVTKTDDADPVNLGDEITYTITVSRSGANRAKNTVLIDNLPAGVEFVSGVASQGSCSENNGVVTCEIGDLRKGDPPATVTIVVRANEAGVITNEASASSESVDPDPSNNTANENTTVLACDLSVDPTGHDFGQVNDSAQKTFVLTNNGNAACIGTATLSGDAAFSIVGGGAFNIAPGQTHNVVVELDCSNSESAEVTGTMTLASNDPGGNIDVGLSGKCIFPDIAADPEELRYSGIPLSNSEEKVFTLMNEGNSDLVINLAQRAGSHGFDWEILNSDLPQESGDPTFTLKPGQKEDFSVRFSPRGIGKRTGRIKFFSNDPDEVEFLVKLKGEGQPSPDIALDQTSLDFGDGEVNEDTKRTVTVTNEGTAELDVTKTDLKGSDASQWAVQNGAPFTLQPGESRVVTLVFTPTSEGLKSASLDIQSNDPDEQTVTVDLEGNGVILDAPDIAVMPDAIDFGDVAFGAAPKDTISIENVGNLLLEVTSTNVTGTNSSQFTVTSGGAPFTLNPGASAELEICFQPTSNGEKTAILEITSNDPNDSKVTVALSGSGFGAPEPNIAVIDTLKFGDTDLSETAKRMIGIINEGSADLNVSSTTIIGDDTSQFAVTAGQAPFTISPGDTSEVEVCFQPETNGFKVAALEITSNDPDDGVTTVILVGNGVGGEPDIAVSADALEFGELAVGATSKKDVEVSNSGTADLNVSAANVVGGDSSEFAVRDGDAPFTLAPGATRTVTICFQPSSGEAKTATLEFLSNDPDENPTQVALTGVGVEVQFEEKILTFGEREGSDVGGVTADSYIDGKRSKRDFNMGATTFLRVGNQGEANSRPNRTLVKFDFIDALLECGISDTSQIIAAQLELQVFSFEGSFRGGITVDLFRVNRDWTEGVTSYDPAAPGEVTFIAAKNGVDNWASAGVEGVPADREGTADASSILDSTGIALWNVSESIKKIFESGQNFGWLLQSQDEDQDLYVRIFSAEHRKQRFRPKLTITLNAPLNGLAQRRSDDSQEKSTVVSVPLPEPHSTLPTAFALGQNYPNPFNPTTRISYELASPAMVTLSVFDITGKEVRRLIDREDRAAGSFGVIWDGRDDQGRLSSSGSYFYQLVVQPQDPTLQPFTQSRKMVLLK